MSSAGLQSGAGPWSPFAVTVGTVDHSEVTGTRRAVLSLLVTHPLYGEPNSSTLSFPCSAVPDGRKSGAVPLFLNEDIEAQKG